MRDECRLLTAFEILDFAGLVSQIGEQGGSNDHINILAARVAAHEPDCFRQLRQPLAKRFL